MPVLSTLPESTAPAEPPQRTAERSIARRSGSTILAMRQYLELYALLAASTSGPSWPRGPLLLSPALAIVGCWKRLRHIV